MATTDDIRRCAMTLPEVEETSHFRFHVPMPRKFRPCTFLGMGKDETTAVFCVSEQEADDAAAADPAIYGRPAPGRLDARRSFLGVQAQLRNVPAERVRTLAENAWRQQAPKRLAAGYDAGRASDPGRADGRGALCAE